MYDSGFRNFDMTRLSKHPFYPMWNTMIQRCTNPRYKDFNNYGAIGITCCEEWLPPKESGFLNFLRDMVDPFLLSGEDYFDPYFKHSKSLDRRFGPAGYNPENCRWVSHEVQTLNRRFGRLGRLGRTYPQGVKWTNKKR
ncbi:hypothetical protein vB_PsyM_KIL4_0155 [Pseudomonas phage vB_PsyM_KIL4]|uniref:Uncharacterized protein n=2 Tax=Flaumdravirus TaxID=2560133 RepID=A0A142IF74_9CAUD|nr:restriction endonuclease [Pseudomonas phage vB_PsyM_KIL4]AMR57879.1 hypothetical protein vB_PsyM_KIL4_0155 [Pseudomonas phage vB_PsyM_KIL4]AMR58048.1 hypothetical protein vB_PsyM_KIL5_0157 [Pseudomonas phage vB_PsyM_KIL5]